MHLARTELLLREVAGYENEIFQRKNKREEGFARQDSARAVAAGGGPGAGSGAEGKAIASGAFGDLYPPRDNTQRALLATIKAFAEAGAGAAAKGGDGGAEQTATLPGNMSGYHRASANLYVTLYGLTASTNPDKSLTVKRQRGPKKEWGGPKKEEAPEDLNDDLDFKTRLKLRLEKREAADCGEQVDEVRFGESGWKERYYQVKLHMGRSDREMSRYVVGCYVQGLCWVLMYYYQGVQDWGWFYPFHYAPCASDLVQLHDYSGGSFELGAPFSPFEQLMAVLPPESGHALPTAYRTLMVHPASPIIDFYPIDFADDLNGKKFAWQAIALLPFIDAPRLKAVVGPLRATLTEEEADRDGERGNLLFVDASHPGAALLTAPNARPLATAVALDSTAASSRGFGGSAQHCPALRIAGTPLEPPPGGAAFLGALESCSAFGVLYEAPLYQLHSPALLAGHTLPPIELGEHEKPQFSRDAETAVRNMAAKFGDHSFGKGGKGGGKGGGYGGGKGGGKGNQPASRMIQGALALGRR